MVQALHQILILMLRERRSWTVGNLGHRLLWYVARQLYDYLKLFGWADKHEHIRVGPDPPFAPKLRNICLNLLQNLRYRRPPPWDTARFTADCLSGLCIAPGWEITDLKLRLFAERLEAGQHMCMNGEIAAWSQPSVPQPSFIRQRARSLLTPITASSRNIYHSDAVPRWSPASHAKPRTADKKYSRISAPRFESG